LGFIVVAAEDLLHVVWRALFLLQLDNFALWYYVSKYYFL
jgi:hypothetical protein